MRCDVYEVEGTEVRFSENDDTVPCLCVWPNSDGETIYPDRLESLALLGATVVLLHHGDLVGPVCLPMGLPQWIAREAERIIWPGGA
jgi:hypothetical protein